MVVRHRRFGSANGWRQARSLILVVERSEILSTPGHTPSSVALFDATNRRLFIGDYIYPTTLYAFLPGASLSAYQEQRGCC